MHAVAVRDGAVVEQAGDTGARRLPALVGEAVPGAPARARPRRPDAGGDRDRVRVASRLAGAARRRSQPAREGACRGGRAGVRAGPTPLQHNCSGKHAGMLALCRAHGLGERRLPPADASGPARLPHEIAAAADVAIRRDPDGRRRLRRAHVRAAARADGADVLPARAARRRRRGRGGDARASRSDPRPDRRRLAPDARARGLDGEGRRRGTALRDRPRRARDRAQGRGREHARDPTGARRVAPPARATRPASSGSSRS